MQFTYKALRNQGLPVELVNKIHEGRPHVIDLIKNRQVGLIINTPSGNVERSDDRLIRSTAVSYKVPCLTNLAAAASAILAMQISREDSLDAIRVQDLSASVR